MEATTTEALAIYKLFLQENEMEDDSDEITEEELLYFVHNRIDDKDYKRYSRYAKEDEQMMNNVKQMFNNYPSLAKMPSTPEAWRELQSLK
jgi:hypothetical protein